MSADSISQLEAALFAIRAFADRCNEPDDVLVYAIGTGRIYGLLVDHNLTMNTGSRVLLQASGDDDLREITVNVTLGGVVVDSSFSESLTE